MCIRFTWAEKHGNSYSSWPSLSSHTLTMSLISHTLNRWYDAFPPTFLYFYSFLYMFFVFFYLNFHFCSLQVSYTFCYWVKWIKSTGSKHSLQKQILCQCLAVNSRNIFPCKAKLTGNNKTGEHENVTKLWKLGFKSHKNNKAPTTILSLEVLLSNLAVINLLQ